MGAVGQVGPSCNFTHRTVREFVVSSASTGSQIAVDGSSSSSLVDSSQVRPWASAVHCCAQDLFGVEGWYGPGRLYTSPDHDPRASLHYAWGKVV